jgi:hypothetical protein
MIDPLQLANVSIKGKTDKNNLILKEPLREVVLALATKNPMWQFIGEVKWDEEVIKFDVKCEDQNIGMLEREWSGRSGGYAVRIDSDNLKHRIRTKDTKKAIREAQRNFIIKSEAKLVEDSIEDVRDVIRNQRYRKNEKSRDRIMKLAPFMREYAIVHNREAFVGFLTNQNSQMISMLEEYETVIEEMQAIEAIDNQRESGKVAYIKLYKGKYIVKVVDNVQSYDDNTFPEEYRGKLGMLKLIDDEQCISGVGCRQSADMFLITL